jgi:hypothetical protein
MEPSTQHPGSGSLERAIAIAAAGHEGQLDKAGAPYILHPLRVMAAQTTIEAKIVAVLHDVVEDTGVTLAELRDEAYFQEPILQALEFVTRRPEDSYEGFIERCAFDPIARAVKLADLEDNMNTLRLMEFDAKAAERFSRYLAAHRRLSVYAEACRAVTYVEYRAHSLELAATVYLIPRGVEFPAGHIQKWPAGALRVRFSTYLTLQVQPDRFLDIKAALDSNDPALLYAIDPEYAPFWCPVCQKTFTLHQWNLQYHGENYNWASGTCPAGHERKIEW